MISASAVEFFFLNANTQLTSIHSTGLMGLGNNVLLELVVVILTWAKTLPALRQIEWVDMSLRGDFGGWSKQSELVFAK